MVNHFRYAPPSPIDPAIGNMILPLQLCLNGFRNEFIEIATKLSAVVACRCSPTQKADIARLIREFTKKRVCCIGDGGNDVSMIQAADVGVCPIFPSCPS